jgi:uncharacterized protein (TIGR03067 family)
VATQLPARPNLDHLKKQAKTLLAELKAGDAASARTFIKHVPSARGLTPAKARAAGFKLADAQSAIARKSGFDSWAALARHVDHLRQLEGEWHFVGLQVDGMDMPATMMNASRLLMNGDRFRMESPEANYEGVFTIEAAAEPMRIDIEFVEGPEAGNWSYGIFELDGDQLTICLGLTGAKRPIGFSTKPGSGHALERLRRASATRPASVTGGARTAADASKGGPQTGPPSARPGTPAPASADVTASFDVPMTPLMRRLEGEWSAVELIRDGIKMPAEWLSFGSRTATGNEVKVVFGGQVMVHAKMKIDERVSPMAVDYLNLGGAAKGSVSLGIMDWAGDDARFLINAPGQPRPSSFPAAPGKGQTFSRWRRRGS